MSGLFDVKPSLCTASKRQRVANFAIFRVQLGSAGDADFPIF
jgi:hypothetical protein